MNDDDRATCAALSDLLRAAGTLACWGIGLALLAALALTLALRALPPMSVAALGACVLAALPERYLAFRLRLDQALFQSLAHADIASLAALDQALERLRLRRASVAPRSLGERAQGTRRLLHGHAAVVALQGACLLIALWNGVLH